MDENMMNEMINDTTTDDLAEKIMETTTILVDMPVGKTLLAGAAGGGIVAAVTGIPKLFRWAKDKLTSKKTKESSESI